MYDMWAAIFLSVGNKAKAHDKRGDIVIVERPAESGWGLYIINKRGEGGGSGIYEMGQLTDILLDDHGINPNAICWLPVEVPFSEEAK